MNVRYGMLVKMETAGIILMQEGTVLKVWADDQ
jgi:hypothetical protein